LRLIDPQAAGGGCWGEFGIPGDTAAGRQRFGEVMEKRRFEADGKEAKALERGWCIGSEQFRRELLVHGQIGQNHFGQERRESAKERGRRILGETLPELHTPTKATSVPMESRLDGFSAMNPSERGKICLHRTEQANALPTSPREIGAIT
jgi:hypothetical protein